ncbi:hypothetical protein Skr01_75660 [Sphaerisporangium krabiense]|uniref:Uncharacterized protein n=1 Tax=Sphaerisporangium krabiense TaxID=763782 RepID=A0A7W8Z2M4_9ACTN|nr:ATP-binding protein [Sphaerisporangium krabiense]MBB5626115.1 hypothetical protein [Sphaerisporangium krabiense]GII67481.1 hypothetical protein Skr01_75660 [Sphaerisporangium krabiense]
MAAQGTAYDVYGLTGNPYTVTPLTPLAIPPDARMPLGLDGFFDPRALDDYLEDVVADGRPAFVVVSGRDFTGRTSMARCVLDHYRRKRGLGDRFVVAEVNLNTFDAFELLSHALGRLRRGSVKMGVPLGTDLDRRLSQVSESPRPGFLLRFQELAEDLETALTAPDTPRHGFGVLIEGLMDVSMLGAAHEVFGDVPCVVVFTHQAGEHAKTAPLHGLTADDAHLLHLHPLGSRQVRLLAEGRWAQATTEHPCPFDGPGLESVFSTELPIKLVLKRLARLLQYRLNTAGREAADAEKLKMSYAWLVETGRLLSEWNGR